jgi:trehalose 6-phosphate synthase/phosphatase
VLAHTAQFWAKNFIKELILNVGTWDQSTPTPYLDHNTITDGYRKARKRLLMFDYDVCDQEESVVDTRAVHVPQF